MSRKKMAMLIVALISALMLIGAPMAWAIGADDDPPPYTLTTQGLLLPQGATFPDGGHVNIQTNLGDRGIHFESLNNQPSGQWIGKDFLPWEAFGLDYTQLCVTWVQVSMYNEHFKGKFGLGCPTTTPPSTPSSSPPSTPTVTPPVISPSSTPSVSVISPPSTTNPSSSPSYSPASTTTPSSRPSPASSSSVVVSDTPIPGVPSTSSSELERLPATGGSTLLFWLLATTAVALLSLGIVLMLRSRQLQ